MIKKISLSLAVLLTAIFTFILFAALSDLIQKSSVPILMGDNHASTSN
jgi:hypothetical protein